MRYLKHFSHISILIILFSLFSGCSEKGFIKRSEVKILLVSTKGMESNIFSPFKEVIEQWADSNEAKIELLEDPKYLKESDIKFYSTIILLDPTVDHFQSKAQSDIQRYVESGGGLIVINSTLTQPFTWPWWSSLQLPGPDTVAYTAMLSRIEEQYFKPISQYPEQVFYSTLENQQLESEVFKSQLNKVLNDAIGKNEFNPATIVSPSAPDESRFTKVVLDDTDVDEPMELTVFPDGKVLFIERKGKMKLYEPKTNKSRVIARFDVCTEGNYEDGLLGLAKDPDFSKNHYIYLYYSPPCEIDSQYLSRFTMHGTDSIILSSEKKMLAVAVQRESCCHSGGSITFDAEGNLYLSTGDNTSSKESDGFSPIDEREGRGPFDAQKSSSNTHDLRGKILRIKPHPYGHYTIPEGNLFPSDGSEGRPEIYIMGARNPFRISVDARTAFVYWGDVGPDGTKEGKYGPQSYDEWNQAQSPGNYGWPYFVGDNKAYRDRDFAMDTVGDYYDPEKPLNLSPNNTGKKDLPPARPAFIWYGKSVSKEFPMLGKGSNSAMAGPVFYQYASQDSEIRFPAYYEGKLFIYEWARSWIKVVEMDNGGDIIKIEPFLPKMPLVKPIDIEFGDDGAMYILEYGQNYFMNNPRARLSRIEYHHGNRKPKAVIAADKTFGSTPLKVEFSALESFDFDENDSLGFEWYLGENPKIESDKERLDYIFETPGMYPVKLIVKDDKGAISEQVITIMAGNSSPDIEIDFDGNQSFFLGEESRKYHVKIEDQEDMSNGGIEEENTKVQLAYIADGEDLEIMLGKQQLSSGIQFLKGKRLIDKSDCLSCHALDLSSVGPSYHQIASRYSPTSQNIEYLSEKVANGGNGNWGEKIMPGHPQHKIEEIREMVKYILSLNDSSSQNLPGEGKIYLNQHLANETSGAYLFSVSYKDKGFKEIPSLSNRKLKILRYPRVQAEAFDEKFQVSEGMAGPNRNIGVIRGIRNGSYLKFSNIDLSGIRSILLHAQISAKGKVEIRLGNKDGELIGSSPLAPGKAGSDFSNYQITINNTKGARDLFIVFRTGTFNNNLGQLDWIEFSNRRGI